MHTPLQSWSVLLLEWMRKRVKECLDNLLYCPGKLSEQKGINHSHWSKILIETSTATIIPTLNNKFEIISFCYRPMSLAAYTRLCFRDSAYVFKWHIYYILHICNRDIGPAVRVFANGPGDLGSIPGRVIPKTLKMVLDTTLLNTQHYKVRFKGKVEQSWEWSSALPYTLV